MTQLNVPGPGNGVRVGTVRGRINGTITTNLQFDLSGFPAFSADDRALLVDLDGDQILFHVISQGVFTLPLDAAINLLSGPFTATYEVLGGTGKFAGLTGRKFVGRGLGTAPTQQPVPGVVFAQVYGVLEP